MLIGGESGLLELFLLRHGLTEENIKGIFQGQMHGSLTSHGKRQAHAIGKNLSKGILKGKEVHVIFCSDLDRAKHSALEVAKSINAEMVLEPLLRERHFGDLQGTKKKKGVNYREFDNDSEELRGKNAESFSSLENRARLFIQKLLALKARVVISVGHSAMNNYIINFLHKEKLGSVRYRLHHGDVYRFVLDDNGKVLEEGVFRFIFDDNGEVIEVKEEKLETDK